MDGHQHGAGNPRFRSVSVHPAEPCAILHRGYSGAADHDEPESTGGKGSPPRRERLQGQPENRDHDRGSLRQGQRHSGQAVGAGKAAESAEQ